MVVVLVEIMLLKLTALKGIFTQAKTYKLALMAIGFVELARTPESDRHIGPIPKKLERKNEPLKLG